MRRCERFAEGGAGLIWLEATAVVEEGRTSSSQLWLHDGTLDAFKALAERMHKLSNGTPLILQLTHSGRFSRPHNLPAPVISYHNPLMNEKMMVDPDYPVVTDEYLDTLPESSAMRRSWHGRRDLTAWTSSAATSISSVSCFRRTTARVVTADRWKIVRASFSIPWRQRPSGRTTILFWHPDLAYTTACRTRGDLERIMRTT